jgi:hypothetical protein
MQHVLIPCIMYRCYVLAECIQTVCPSAMCVPMLCTNPHATCIDMYNTKYRHYVLAGCIQTICTGPYTDQQNITDNVRWTRMHKVMYTRVHLECFQLAGRQRPGTNRVLACPALPWDQDFIMPQFLTPWPPWPPPWLPPWPPLLCTPPLLVPRRLPLPLAAEKSFGVMDDTSPRIL